MRVTITTNTKTLTEIIWDKYAWLLTIKEHPWFDILLQNLWDAIVYINQNINNDEVFNWLTIESGWTLSFSTDMFDDIILAAEEDNDNVRLFITRK